MSTTGSAIRLPGTLPADAPGRVPSLRHGLGGLGLGSRPLALGLALRQVVLDVVHNSGVDALTLLLSVPGRQALHPVEGDTEPTPAFALAATETDASFPMMTMRHWLASLGYKHPENL